MAIDFTRTASDKIVCSSVPLGSRPFVLECWFNHDGWDGGGITHGALMGIYATIHNFKVMLRIQKDETGFPTFYYLEFAVKNASGTFISRHATDLTAGTWYHALGFWNATTGYGIAFLDGTTPGTSFTNAGLAIGFNEYTFGYDPCAGGDAFDGQMCEWAAWNQNYTSSTIAKDACKGWNPIDRDPFFYPAGGAIRLKSWVQGHKLSVFDIMRPSATYTETGVSKAEDHAPVFEAPHCEPYPRPPLVLATRRVTVGGYCSTDTRKLLAG